MLIPNNKQKTKLFQCFGVSRFAYNQTLAKQQENYNKGGKFISDNDLRSKISIKYELNKERRSYKKTSNIKKLEIILICTDTLVRNLRLWSVQKM